ERVLYGLGIIEDITERKRAEEALQAQACALAAQTKRLEALAGLSRTVSGTLVDPQQVFQAVVQATTQLLEDSTANLWLMEGDEKTLRLQADSARKPHLRQHTRIPMGQGLVGSIAQEKRPLLVEDVQKDPRAKNVDWHRAEGIHATLGVPLLLGEKCLGALTVNRRSSTTFDEADLDLLSAFAAQAATALENARLYHETRTRAEKLEALATLGRSVSASLDPQRVLDFVVQSTARLLGANLARLWLWDEAVGALRHGATAGDPDLTPYPRHLFRSGEGLIGLAFERREALVTESPTTDPRYLLKDWVQEKGIRTIAAVPLLIGDQALGILTAVRRTAEPFRDEGVGLLQSFAAQAAIAITNARLFRETQTRAEKLAALAELSRTVSGSLNPQHVLDFVVQATARLLEVSLARLWLWNESAGQLELAASAGEPDLVLYPRDAFQAGEGLVGLAYKKRETLATDSPATDPRYVLQEWAREKGIQSIAAIPLLVGDKAVGVLSAARRAPGPYQTEELDLLGSFAAQAAIAITNARLFRETQTRAEKLKALAELSRTVTATLDPAQVFAFIIQASCDLLSASVATLWTVEGEELHLQAGRGLHSDRRVHRHFRLGEGMVGWIAQHRQPMVVPEFADDPQVRNRDWAIAEGLHAFAGVPLLVEARCVGVLCVIRTSPQPFGPDEMALLTAFADQAAIAIEHTRLYQEIRQHAVGLEQIVQTRTAELRQRNFELEAANRAKSQFLTTMSHELRTPLNAILGFSELLQDQAFGPLTPKQQRYVQNIWTSGRHLLELINDVLDLAKVEAGKLQLHLDPFDVRAVLQAACDHIRPQATANGLELTLDLGSDLPHLYADPLRLKQILYNLLSNAVKFTPSGGRVTIRVRSVDSDMEFAVQDTGIGIKQEDLPRLFETFTQLDASLGRQHQGTGLGLALTKNLVELHGGRIWVESPGEGQGSIFTFTLPREGPRVPGQLEATSPFST
ncbi:MAG: GAF domain-containing protein, partial [Candidatus Methylomirabilales bacterium]